MKFCTTPLGEELIDDELLEAQTVVLSIPEQQSLLRLAKLAEENWDKRIHTRKTIRNFSAIKHVESFSR